MYHDHRTAKDRLKRPLRVSDTKQGVIALLIISLMFYLV